MAHIEQWEEALSRMDFGPLTRVFVREIFDGLTPIVFVEIQELWPEEPIGFLLGTHRAPHIRAGVDFRREIFITRFPLDELDRAGEDVVFDAIRYDYTRERMNRSAHKKPREVSEKFTWEIEGDKHETVDIYTPGTNRETRAITRGGWIPVDDSDTTGSYF